MLSMTKANQSSAMDVVEQIQGVVNDHYQVSEVPSEPLDLTSQSVACVALLMEKSRNRDRQNYKALLNLRGDDAQKTLDTLQSASVFPQITRVATHRAATIKVLIRLAKHSGLYPRCFKTSQFRIVDNEPIGEGSYGKVWKACLGDRVACVKILKADPRRSHQYLLKTLLQEGLIWAQLSCHTNITPFLGICVGGIHENDIGLVSEWMSNGNIVEYLKRQSSASRMDLIRDIASGLQYLHTQNIVHGDIKGRNILINSSGRACLADFGLAKVLAHNIPNWSSSGSSHCGGTSRWRAPELICEEANTGQIPPNTPASDVYSFTCTMYEVLADQIPFHEIQNPYQLLWYRLSRPGLQPARRLQENEAEEISEEVWQLMGDGWYPNPKRRPTMQEMLGRLKEL